MYFAIMKLVTKKGSKQFIVIYYSKHKMAEVAVGIIKGIAKYFDEVYGVKITRLTASDEEKV
ncbi:heme NO-binding domain-containing protein [Pontibacter sp. HJ8]